jgi:hypothetical protein
MQSWRITVYGRNNNELSSWILVNRTEDEALHEAENDVVNLFPESVDWSMVETTSM